MRNAAWAGLLLCNLHCGGETLGTGEDGDGGSGGGAGEGAATTASLVVVSSSAGTGGGGGGEVCVGTLALQPACVPCADRSCCEVQAACSDDDACLLCLTEVTVACAANARFQALDSCLQDHCEGSCNSLTPAGPACDAPQPSPSAGSCITIGGAIGCNPFDNEGCIEPKVCDAGIPSGFACFDPPSDTQLCEPCGSAVGNYCAPGLTCVGVCYKLCCDDGDCGSGECDKTHAQYAPAGLCVEPDP